MSVVVAIVVLALIFGLFKTLAPKLIAFLVLEVVLFVLFPDLLVKLAHLVSWVRTSLQ